MEDLLEKLDNIKNKLNTESHFERTRILISTLDSIVSRSDSLLKEQKEINQALNLMLLAHFQQKDRPDGQPYINHPLDVALHLANEYQISDSNMIVAALLHDTVEDNAQSVVIWGKQNVNNTENLEIQALQILQQHFGKDVSDLVSSLTNPDFNIEAKRLAKNKEEETTIKVQLYLEHFKSIYDENVRAFVIKMADFSQNALHIDVLEESPRKNWFRQKYGPVILMVIQRLKDLEDTSHPLFGAKEAIIKNLSAVYTRDYITAT